MAWIKITKTYGMVECIFLHDKNHPHSTVNMWSKNDAGDFFNDLQSLNIPSKTDGYWRVNFNGDTLNKAAMKLGAGTKFSNKKWMPKWTVGAKKKGLAPVDLLKLDWEKPGSASKSWDRKVSVKITGKPYNSVALTPPPFMAAIVAQQAQKNKRKTVSSNTGTGAIVRIDVVDDQGKRHTSLPTVGKWEISIAMGGTTHRRLGNHTWFVEWDAFPGTQDVYCKMDFDHSTAGKYKRADIIKLINNHLSSAMINNEVVSGYRKGPITFDDYTNV